MTSIYIRNKWISFFLKKGHFDVSNRSLIPVFDNSLLFINSGIAAIKEYFCGDQIPPSKRLVSCQKVVRTGDIESIGDSFRHHTYFEMLGNFSIGDYFKLEVIPWAWEFLIKELNFAEDKLYVSVYSEDKEALIEWKKLIPESRIVIGDKSTNFWDMGVGPCGPCSEIYFDRGKEYDDGRPILENDRYLEIWNIVFSEFLNVDGKLLKAPTKNIDTGSGLERLVMIMEGKESNFETSLFVPIVNYLNDFCSLSKNQIWAVSDYLRTSCILIRDGICFGNKGREYVLRRLFRKAIFIAKNFELDLSFFKTFVQIISSTLSQYTWDIDLIGDALYSEYLLIKNMISKSIKFLNELMDKYENIIPSLEVFKLITSYGFEFSYLSDFLTLNHRSVDEEEVKNLLENHKQVSANKQISSAFAKRHPNLLNLKMLCKMDYLSEIRKSKIVGLFDDQFNICNQSVSEGYMILDHTILFPLSAGQDADKGFINNIPITSSLITVNGQILHKFVGDNLFSIGDEIEVVLDSYHRKGLEIHHTLEHLLVSLIKSEISSEIFRSGGFKHSDSFTLEITVPNSVKRSDFDLYKLNEKLNDLISRNLEVSFEYITLKEAIDRGFSQKFIEVYKRFADDLRVVNIENYSIELCSGTHVSNTSVIQKALITEFKKKQSNVYKFRVIGGNGNVNNFLNLNNSSFQEFIGKFNVSNESKNKEVYKLSKSQLSSEILEFKDSLMIINRDLNPLLVSSVFRDIRLRLVNRLVIWFWTEDKNSHRFFVVGDLFNLKDLESCLKQRGWKCGGTSNFLGGTAITEDFRREITDLLLELNPNQVI